MLKTYVPTKNESQYHSFIGNISTLISGIQGSLFYHVWVPNNKGTQRENFGKTQSQDAFGSN